MRNIICYTKFKLDPFSDGGSKRSVQVRELLKKNGISFIDDSFTLPKNVPYLVLAKWSIKAIVFIKKHYPKERIKSFSHYIHLIKYFALRIPVVLEKYKGQEVVFLLENTNDRDLPYLMKASGHHIIALPHNIESMVNGQSIRALEEEAGALGVCDVVFTISKEETWFLRLSGIDSHYLPYFPPDEVESFLLAIRQKRELRMPNTLKRFALLGSATNTPTRSGMQSLINFLSGHELSFDILIAGYGTESLTKVSHPNISFLGTLSNEELERMLVEIDGIIIYQPPTTGALTRIPEILLAGVPIFANFNAARNYFGVKDILIYDSFDILIETLKSFVPHQASQLSRGIAYESLFTTTVRNFCSLS